MFCKDCLVLFLLPLFKLLELFKMLLGCLVLNLILEMFSLISDNFDFLDCLFMLQLRLVESVGQLKYLLALLDVCLAHLGVVFFDFIDFGSANLFQ